jgi:phosphoglycolate phosphatase
MNSRAVLFDLDGTLVDSRPGILASLHAALRELGHSPDPSIDLTWAIGPPLEDSMELLLRPYRDDRTREAVEAYRRHYRRHGVSVAAEYPGIRAAIDAMNAAGWRLFIATSKRASLARELLSHLDLSDRFAAIHGSTEDGSLDQKGPLIAHILRHEALDAAHAVMVGDRRHDVAGARANRVPVVGVAWGYGTRTELQEAGADAVIDDTAELMSAVASAGLWEADVSSSRGASKW